MKNTKPLRRKVRLAIIGTGGMCGTHARNFKAIDDCEIVAVCDVDETRAKYFAAEHNVLAHFNDTAEMLKKVEIDAVSIVTPDAFHAPVALKCLAAGKHVLCEKPLAVNHADAKKMAAAAKKAGVINMVNFSYRDWCCIQEVAERVQRGDIGEVIHVEACYLQTWLTSRVWGEWKNSPGWLWRLSTSHGSKGALGDIGVHIVDFATYPVGPIVSVDCRLKAFPKVPKNRLGEYRLDANDSAVMTVEFKNGALGVIHTTRWATGHPNQLKLRIFGRKGGIEIDSELSTTGYTICIGANLHQSKWEKVEVKPTPTNYQRFIRAIKTGKPEQADFVRGAEVQKVLDACFVSDEKKKPVRVC
jgi:predicted dehydrogenase